MKMYHARLFTMDGPVVEDGWIEWNDGVISAMGEGKPAHINAEDVDARGCAVTPGMIDAHTHLGMWEDGLGFEGEDGNEDTDPVTPQLRAIDAISPLDRCFREACEAGVTTVVTGPGSANAIGGQLCAVKTDAVCIDDAILRAPLAIKMALGENPKNVYHDKSQAPVTRMAIAALIREQLLRAQRYMREMTAAEEEGDKPDFDFKCEALLPLLRREIPAHIHAHRIDDIFTAVRICEEFQLDYVIVHGTEAHLQPERIRRTGAPILCGPILCDRAKPEMRNLDIAAAGILYRNQIPFAIITDHPVVPIQYLPLTAHLAVRGGLPPMEALRAVTSAPAQILNLAERVGSLRPGKDADLLLWGTAEPMLAELPRGVVAGGRWIRYDAC